MNPVQPSLTELLDEIEARANAATPVPWIREASSSSVYGVPDIYTKNRDCIALIDSGGALWNKDQCEANGAFIAAARSDVPRLVEALRRAVQAIEVMGLHYAMSDISPGIELREMASILAGKSR